jgi:signal recognition particle subunit SRP54
MVLEKLGSSLKNTLNKIAKAVFVDEKLINELIKDIQRALLHADVNVKLVFEFTKKIKERILKEDTPAGLTKKEHLINIVYEELVVFLGGEGYKIDITKKPFKIMLVGLFGSGKTTTAGKLSKFFTKRGYKVCLLGLDIHRPAAITQLEQIAKQINVPVFADSKTKDVIKIYKKFEKQLNEFDIIIIDTAGRDALSKDLIEEIESINKKIQPDERVLVISADIGQTAQKQAEQFHESCNITGVIATKMDGTAKAGGALSACAVTKAPIKFIGIGEKTDDLEEFKPKNFVGRLLGMGDLEALLEKAKEAISEEDAEDLGKRFLKGDFSLIDLYEQMQAMKKMGPLNKVVEMIPGFGQLKLPKEALKTQEGKLDKWKVAMQSMTKEELEEPEIINADRIERISKGSGLGAKDIRELIKQYRQSKKMIKMMKGSGDMNKMMKKFKGKMPKGMGM